jgi:hypothetical protein
VLGALRVSPPGYLRLGKLSPRSRYINMAQMAVLLALLAAISYGLPAFSAGWPPACEEVANAQPDNQVMRPLQQRCRAARLILDELDEIGRGVGAVALVMPEYSKAVGRLRLLLLREGSPVLDGAAMGSLDRALGRPWAGDDDLTKRYPLQP